MCEVEQEIEVQRHFPGESALWEKTFWTVLPGAVAGAMSRGDELGDALAIAARAADEATPLRQQRADARLAGAKTAIAEATARVLEVREYVTRRGEARARVTVERVEGSTCIFTDGSHAEVVDVASGEGFEPNVARPESQKRPSAPPGCPGCGWPVDAVAPTLRCLLGPGCRCGAGGAPDPSRARLTPALAEEGVLEAPAAALIDATAAEVVAEALSLIGVGPDEVEIRAGELRVTVRLEDGLDAAELHGVLVGMVRDALSRRFRKCGPPSVPEPAVPPSAALPVQPGPAERS